MLFVTVAVYILGDEPVSRSCLTLCVPMHGSASAHAHMRKPEENVRCHPTLTYSFETEPVNLEPDPDLLACKHQRASCFSPMLA